jgi:hypothetical protein
MKNLVLVCLVALLVKCTVSSEDLAQARADGVYLKVRMLAVDAPNSAGGVALRVSYANTGLKPLKYVQMLVQGYNQFGDLQVDSISGDAQRTVTFTGLVEPGAITGDTTGLGLGNPVAYNTWYNSNVRCAILGFVVVTYMDDTMWESNDIAGIMGQEEYNRCGHIK